MVTLPADVALVLACVCLLLFLGGCLLAFRTGVRHRQFHQEFRYDWNGFSSELRYFMSGALIMSSTYLLAQLPRVSFQLKFSLALPLGVSTLFFTRALIRLGMNWYEKKYIYHSGN